MKKSIYRIVSLVVAMAIALTMTAFAADDVGATVTVSGISDVNVGDTVSLSVMLEIENKVNSVAFADLSYDKKVLKFKGFAEISQLNEKAMFKTWDVEPMFVAMGFGESIPFDENNGRLFNLEFEVLKPGKTEVSLDAVVKNNADTFNVNVVAGSVSVLGDVDEKVENVENEEETNDFDSQKRAKDTICLKIDESSAFAFGKVVKIDEDNDKVVPYIVNGRTLVPLRFVSETLGAEVQWENGWNYCYVNKGDKKIKITFGSADIEVNGEVVTYDAPVEVVENRTMVPIRFISEELGYHVYWNDPNRAVVITPLENPWVEEREAETSLFMDMLVTFLMMGMI